MQSASEQEIPAGMKPWSGGDSAPEDWDKTKPVKRRGGAVNMVHPGVPTAWVHDDAPMSDIIAYTPLPSPAPMVEQAGELKPCPNPWCTATTKPIPAHMKREGWRVICACGVSTFRQETEAQAIAVWNTRPAPAETEGVGRDEIARIIDPEAFKTLREIAAEKGLDAANPPAGVVLLDPIDAPRLSQKENCAAALATADRILVALSTPPADAGMRDDMAAFGASDAACYHYPEEDQQAQRTAFCAGAAWSAQVAK